MMAANLQYNDRFPQYGLKVRLVWSKNVNDERDAPWQTIFGSVATTFCVLINVGIWLELNLSTTPGGDLSPYVFGFSHDNTIPDGGDRSKLKARNILSPIFKGPFFRHNNVQDKVGTHSIRKFAATHCRNSGISKDDVDSRGRWKNTGRTADRYEDPTLPFVDIKACIALCQGGACAYIPKPGCITADFVCMHVAPHIEAKYGRAIATIFGNAITWAIFSTDMVPELIHNRVMTAYNVLAEKLPDGENPMYKKELFLIGGVDKFSITEINENEGGANGNGAWQGDGAADVQYGGVGQAGMQHFTMINNAQHRDTLRAVTDNLAASRDRDEFMLAKLLRLEQIILSFVNQMNRRPHLMLQAAAIDRANSTVIPWSRLRSVIHSVIQLPPIQTIE